MVTDFNLVKYHGHNIPLTKFIYAKRFSNTSPFKLLRVKQLCGSHRIRGLCGSLMYRWASAVSFASPSPTEEPGLASKLGADRERTSRLLDRQIKLNGEIFVRTAAKSYSVTLLVGTDLNLLKIVRISVLFGSVAILPIWRLTPDDVTTGAWRCQN